MSNLVVIFSACTGPASILVQVVDGVGGGVCCGRANVLVGRGGEAIAKLVKTRNSFDTRHLFPFSCVSPGT